MENRAELILVSNLQRMRVRLSATLSRREKRRALGELRESGATTVPYLHSAHYLAFMIAYLMDEEVLPDRDWEQSASLREIRGKKLTDVLPREGVALEKLRAEQYDALELRREFHGGGKLDDPGAEEALLDAIRVLRENFELIDNDGALIVGF